jgi:hypothetical protein
VDGQLRGAVSSSSRTPVCCATSHGGCSGCGDDRSHRDTSQPLRRPQPPTRPLFRPQSSCPPPPQPLPPLLLPMTWTRCQGSSPLRSPPPLNRLSSPCYPTSTSASYSRSQRRRDGGRTSMPRSAAQRGPRSDRQEGEEDDGRLTAPDIACDAVVGRSGEELSRWHGQSEGLHKRYHCSSLTSSPLLPATVTCPITLNAPPLRSFSPPLSRVRGGTRSSSAERLD